MIKKDYASYFDEIVKKEIEKVAIIQKNDKLKYLRIKFEPA